MRTQKRIEAVKNNLLKKTSHTYLLQHLPQPIIDEYRILLTISLLEETNLTESDIITYATSISLIQLALDTHELVSNESLHDESEKKRQLTVLAGDLFSGYYYKLLAEIENLPLLKSLSRGIKEVNENKILFYHQDVKTIEQLKTSLENIEGSLINQLITSFQLDPWRRFSLTFLYLNRLLKEKEIYLQQGDSMVVNAFLTYRKKRRNIAGIEDKGIVLINQCIHEATKNLEASRMELPTFNHPLHLHLNEMLQNNNQQLYVEEG